ncbi:alkaline phosphatase [Rheinheimera baltica]|uniref:alkaline phosphatase n=1 Tax=Rheinheimera baltica TaxID=67576 RepID=UPI00273DE120|nr:alkaline phosphatase [Rheinheimera baltica]MDP5141417.1 alkaline phosphatase [Rheinheimera baltica]
MRLHLLSLSLLLAPSLALAAPKNIIYMIGDGMGPTYLSAYRYYQDDSSTKVVESTIFDELWQGMASTYPDDDTYVTDSAAGATALATGEKSYNGAISVNRQHIPIGTMMQLAKRLGKANGIVASSQINHATPASFLAHNKSRSNYDDIANMYVDYKINGRPVADVMLGGGIKYFQRKDRDLVSEFKQLGFQYTDSWQHLDTLTQLPALALLAETALPAALNSSQNAQLATLTTKALKLLTPAEKGFVLMVEGSQIDWCGHDNDIACAMAEMDDFAKAIAVAKAYVDQHPDTLLIITADHETGGMTLGAAGEYLWLPKVVQKVKATGRSIATQLKQAESDTAALVLWADLTSITLTEEEQAALLAARQQDEKTLRVLSNQLVAKYSYTGWTTGGHTATDVAVLAYGKWRDDFSGFQDNTEIAKKLIQFIQQTK